MCRGRCRSCRDNISVRYPAVEILSAFIWAVSWSLSSKFLPFLVSVVFLSLLLIVFFTDCETGLIPDLITLPGIVTGIALSFFYPPLQGAAENLSAFYSSLSGLCAGALMGCAAGWLGKAIFKKDAFGGGDIKFLAMLGAFLGWQSVTFTFFLAPFFALPFAFYARWIKKLEVIPYGPFLSLAAAFYFSIRQVF